MGKRSSPASSPGGLPPLAHNKRDRAVTASTASTATPPRLFDSDLALENSEMDGFGNMFDHIESSSQSQGIRLIQSEERSSPPTSYPPTSYSGPTFARSSRAPIPQPISTDRNQIVESSPYSWTSHDSHDGLIRSPSPSRTVTQGSPARAVNGSLVSSGQNPLPPPRPVQKRPTAPRESPPMETLRPLSVTRSRTNEETKLLSTSPTITQKGEMSPASLHSASFDPSIAADAELANMYQETKPQPPKPASSNKVMTPQQWERYKQQKEMDRRLGALSDDSGSEAGDNYEDDDEVERDRQATKQRRKQEAHLAVYRQQMMKVTGEAAQPPPESGLGALRHANGSSGDLDNRLSHLTVASRQSGGKSSGEDEDEDEDVPLGILAAHGFPNRNRPPTRLANSPSNSNLRSVSQPPPQTAPSVAGQTAKGTNLPVFARGLPQDPYYGASLVNQPVRESLAAHSLSPSALGSGPSTAHPIHPAGLVGVIAGEERARAARRGSPNPAGNYEMPQLPPHPGMARSQTTGYLPGMGYPPTGMPGMPPMMTPADHAQLQMSQQMTQMMQMQMQWMQQMQSMMGPGGQPQMGPPSLAAPSIYGGQGPRPHSMQPPVVPSHVSQRTMSTLNPGMAPWNSTPSFLPSINLNGNYAPSIAPSERSNIGLASRYRPVSTMPEPEPPSTKRASTFTSASYQPWSQTNTRLPGPSHAARPSVNTLGRRSPLTQQQDDEDDEQGWAEMKMKKDKKQKNWALRKEHNGLQELYTGASS
ncbi:uncharacterized protein A1O9_10209 [Exophiala aquamarina CBS 119918]|uniref:Uncharacterized protein n=1 Tax=Exophiala aquamarina CBS 119918 TaxID=1182545 RepID=A0A072P3I4_9EURO|nr:uncharacterized protein A1O9_10209 [Exophiala aquamarina CBS 119918]KEF53808.1 hypothetical protein A1O9_10209 [Exophiala aquamarina CBS 119918]